MFQNAGRLCGYDFHTAFLYSLAYLCQAAWMAPAKFLLPIQICISPCTTWNTLFRIKRISSSTLRSLLRYFLMSSFDIIDQGGEISEADGRFQICICFSLLYTFFQSVLKYFLIMIMLAEASCICFVMRKGKNNPPYSGSLRRTAASKLSGYSHPVWYLPVLSSGSWHLQMFRRTRAVLVIKDGLISGRMLPRQKAFLWDCRLAVVCIWSARYLLIK